MISLQGYLKNTYSAWYKPALAGLLVLLAGLFGYFASLSLALGLVAALLVWLAIQILLKQPAWGLLAVIPVSLMGRFNLSSGTNVPITMIILLTGTLLAFWLFRMVALDREIRLAPSRINLPALVFMVVTSLGLVFGFVPWLPLASESAPVTAQLGGWALYVFSMGMLLLVPSAIKQEVWLRRLVWLFIALSSVYMLLRAIPGSRPLLNLLFVPSNSLGSMFWIWVAALTAGQAIFNPDLSRPTKVFLFMLLGITFYVSLIKASSWHSGWFPPLISLGVIFALRSWRHGLGLALLVLIFVMWRAEDVLGEVRSLVETYTVTSRIATWPIMIEIIKANPIIGVGPANYRYYTSLYSIWGYYIQFNSHNNYMDILAQTGFLGLAVFGWLIFEITRLALVLRKRVQSGFAKGYVNAALGSLAAMLVAGFIGDWFLPFVYNIGFTGFRASILAWLFLGGLLTFEQILAKGTSKVEDDHPGQLAHEQAGVG